MSNEFRFRKDENKVLGAGGYSLDHDDVGSLQYTGLYQGKEIVALLVSEWKEGSQERMFALGDRIVAALNSHDRWAKWIIQRGLGLPDHACAECVPHSDMLVAGFQCVYHEALAAAGEQP